MADARLLRALDESNSSPRNHAPGYPHVEPYTEFDGVVDNTQAMGHTFFVLCACTWRYLPHNMVEAAADLPRKPTTQ